MKTLASLLTVTIIALGVFVAASAWQGSSAKTTDKNKVEITEKNGYRHIKSNGIPDHEPGQFPNRRNPNRISAQKYNFKVPMNPNITSNRTPPPSDGDRNRRRGERRGPPSLFGVALNGIPFDPGTAEAWNNDRSSGWNNEALTGKMDLGIDKSNAHVQPTGAYHYHGIPNGFVENLKPDDDGMILVGYAADGFPVYTRENMKTSYRLKSGTRSSGPGGKYDGTYFQDFEYVAGLGDLDECNGRTGVAPGYPDGTYHYFLSDTFPYIPRCHKGTPDQSFKKGPPPGGRFGRPGGRRGGRRGPPRRPQ